MLLELELELESSSVLEDSAWLVTPFSLWSFFETLISADANGSGPNNERRTGNSRRPCIRPSIIVTMNWMARVFQKYDEVNNRTATAKKVLRAAFKIEAPISASDSVARAFLFSPNFFMKQ